MESMEITIISRLKAVAIAGAVLQVLFNQFYCKKILEGAWDWSFLQKRIALPEPEDKKLPSKIQPFPSPAMAGGLFAINRQYFKDIMYYDPGLEIWGGENFELSYKLWMCGGGMLFVPCSRVGHIYRLEGMILKICTSLL